MTTHRLAITVTVALLGSFAPGAFGEDCYNAAYRYCCDITPGFVIPCAPAEGGQCTGIVVGGDNDFKQTRVPGLFTDASFNTLNVDYSCTFREPICNPTSAPYCTWEEEPRTVNCIAWELKQTWFMCVDV